MIKKKSKFKKMHSPAKKPVPHRPGARPNFKRKKKNNTLIFIIIAAAAVLISAAIGVGVFFSIKKDDGKNNVSHEKYIGNVEEYGLSSGRFGSFYDNLTDKQKKLYEEAVNRFDSKKCIFIDSENKEDPANHGTVFFDGEYSLEDTLKVSEALGNDMPIINNDNGSFMMTHSSSDGKTQFLPYGTISIIDSDREEFIQNIEKEIKKILSAVPEDAGDLEKEFIIYKHFADLYENYRAPKIMPRGDKLSLLFKGEFLDEDALARAFKIVLDYAGIDNRIAFSNEGLKWNQVKIDSNWYNCFILAEIIDGPLEISQNNKIYRYFNVTDSMKGREYSTDPTLSLPKCDSHENNYVKQFIYSAPISFSNGNINRDICKEIGDIANDKTSVPKLIYIDSPIMYSTETYEKFFNDEKVLKKLKKEMSSAGNKVSDIKFISADKAYSYFAPKYLNVLQNGKWAETYFTPNSSDDATYIYIEYENSEAGVKK